MPVKNNEIAYEITHAPAYASLKLCLQPNQTVFVEAGGMAAMDTWINMKSKVQGRINERVGANVGG